MILSILFFIPYIPIGASTEINVWNREEFHAVDRRVTGVVFDKSTCGPLRKCYGFC